MSAQVFLYPEELVLARSPAAVAGLVRDIGIDGVALAAIYHRARRVFPRYGAVSETGGGVLCVRPGSDYGALAPPGELDAAVREFRAACDREGLRFSAWVVALHDEPLVRARPELASRYGDGSPSGFALCPSRPGTADYLRALVADVDAQLRPDTIDLEAWAYPAWEPGYTLTLALDTGELARLATCGCDACATLPSGRAARAAEVLADACGAARAPLRPLVFGDPGGLAALGVEPDVVRVAAAVGAGAGALTGAALAGRVDALTAWLGRPPDLVSTNWAPDRTPAAYAADAESLARAGVGTLGLYNLSLVPEHGLPALAAAAASFREAR